MSRIIAVLIGLIVMVWGLNFGAGEGYAQDVLKDQTWISGMEQLRRQVNSKEYSQALETAKPLYSIHPEDPVLYLYTGLAVKGQGEESRALKYFKRASELVTNENVSPKDAQLIWNTLYEIENPESSVDEVVKRKAEINKLQEELKEQEKQNQISMDILATTGSMNIVDTYKTILLTGVVVGAAGIIMSIASGIALAVVPKTTIKSNSSGDDAFYICGGYVTAWSFLGVGLGLSVIGAVMSGYGGYFMNHLGDAPENMEHEDYSFHIGPGSVGFSMNF